MYIFFDLDGTLLSMDTKKFEHGYFSSLGDFMSDLLPKEAFIQYLLKSTGDMIKNDGLKTNREMFLDSFSTFIEKDSIGVYEKRFYDYYEGPFQALERVANPVATIQEDVALLKEKGYRLILATNPLFPKSAVISRLRWAGLNSDDFDYISSFEVNRFCKPQLGFYEEILRTLNLSADQCLMVGNDVEEDLVSQKLGFKTYLITNHQIQRSEIAFTPDYSGDYDDFHYFVKQLPMADLTR